MKLSLIMIINAIVALVFGIAFVLAPTATGSLYGLAPDETLKYIVQLFGAALLSIGVLTWLAKNAAESEALKAIVLALFVGNAVGFIVALMGQLAGVVNTLGWLSVAIYLVLALGYGYFQFLKPSAA